MSMIIGIGQVTIQIPESQSLKDKRRVVKSVAQRVRNRFDVAIAEVDDQQVWQTATLGIACVSNSAQHCDEVVQRVIGFIDQSLQSGYVIDVHTETMHV